jgi:PAS domain S-box-containing protein
VFRFIQKCVGIEGFYQESPEAQDMIHKPTYEELEQKFKGLQEENNNLKLMEEDWRESEEKYRTLIENVNIGVYRNTGDPRGRFLQANPAMVRMFGYDSVEEFMNVSVSDLYQDPEDRKRFITKIKKDGIVEDEEIRLHKKDGTPLWCAVKAKIQYDRNSKVQWMDGVIEDITERKEAEKAIRKSERRLADIIDFLPDATFAIDLQGSVISWNRAIEEMTGVKAKDILGKGTYEYALPFYGMRRPVLIDLALNPDKETEKKYTFISRKGDCVIAEPEGPTIVRGKDVFLWGKASPIYDHNGNIIGAIESIRDITHRKSTEEELKKEKDKAQRYLDVAGVMLVVINADQTVAMMNKKGCDVLGYREEEIIGKNWIDMFVPERMRSGIKSVFTKLMNGHIKPVEYFENPVLTKKGMERTIAWHNTLLTDECNNIIGSLSSGEDITERKKTEGELKQARSELEIRVKERTAELMKVNKELKREIVERQRSNEALRESEERYRTLVEDTPALICRFLADGTLSFVNSSYCEYFRKDRSELVGADFFQFIPMADQEKVRTYFESLAPESPVKTYEHQVVAPDGEIHWQRWTDRALFDENVTLIEYQSIGYDITDRKKTEEALKKSEKQLSFLSTQLVTAQEDERKHIAQELHDSIGQILTTVKFGVERTAHEVSQVSAESSVVTSLESLVPIVQNGIEEIRRICSDLWPFILDDLGILATISWFCREFQKVCTDIRIDKHIDIEENDVPNNLKIVIYRILQEAVNNIAKHSSADYVRCSLEKKRGRIELSIEDNGKGFDTENIRYKVTSKRGFGLASMKKRTEMSGGSFSIESERGSGTTIRGSWLIKKPLKKY